MEMRVKLMPPNVVFPDKPVIKELSEAPPIPKPVIQEVVAEAGTVQEVAQVADSKKA